MRLRHRPPYSGRFGAELAHHRRMLDDIGGREYQQPEAEAETEEEQDDKGEDDGRSDDREC